MIPLTKPSIPLIIDDIEMYKRTNELILLDSDISARTPHILEAPSFEMGTATILIGNSDDQLSQKEWSSFYNEVNVLTSIHTNMTHFAGASIPDKPWQNACWVVDVNNAQRVVLKHKLAELRDKYRQESIAWVEGTTTFI